MKSIDAAQSGQIVRAVLLLGRRLRAERPPGAVSLSAIGILSTLRRLGPMPAVRLAGEEQLKPQSLTRLITSLEREGLISRTPGTVDRREILISATKQGLAVLAADFRARERWLEQAMADALSRSEMELLLRASPAMLKLAGYPDGAARQSRPGARRLASRTRR